MSSDRANARMFGVPMKYISLTTLTVQNASLILLMHYSRIMPGWEDRRYLSSTAVFLNECMKLAVCSSVVMYQQRAVLGPNWTPYRALRSSFTKDTWKLAIPAALYTVQNNLQYVAVSNLDAATFQVTYQFKIITTAIFSVTMLRRQISTFKWATIVMLTVGIALVQMPSGSGAATKSASATAHATDMDRTVGLVAVICACALSGLAGVYFEKVLKGSNQSFWALNIQLSLFSLPPALILGCWFKDGAAISERGFLYGYNAVVWSVVVCQAAGGIIVAMCVAYADNLLKNFATSVSIVISAVVSVWLFDFVLTLNFLIGAAIVLAATYMYGLPDSKTVAAANANAAGALQGAKLEALPTTRPPGSQGNAGAQAYQAVSKDDDEADPKK